VSSISPLQADAGFQGVAARVAQGGHNIPEDVIRRRFNNGRRNFKDLYQSVVDDWILYDNSDRIPVLLEWSEKHDNK
jgi:predicted ABC-type ATPase